MSAGLDSRPLSGRAPVVGPRSQSSTRGITAAVVFTGVLIVVGLIVQTSVAPFFSWHNVVPNILLLVVVAIGLARGSHFAMVSGFAAGVLLDLAPPADHIAGRWALALLAVGYLAGRVQSAERPSWLLRAAAIAACSVAGTTIFGLTGLIFSDPGVGIPDLLRALVFGVGYDLVVGLVLVSLCLRGFARLDPEQSAR